ncbi:hypothetical protein C5S42_01200, partial [Candidatus Methanomarinus sp.]
LPTGSYANEVIEEFSGHFTISFELTRPFIKSIDEATKTEEYDLSIPFPWFFGRMVFHLEREVPLTEAEKDAIFEEQYMPDIHYLAFQDHPGPSKHPQVTPARVHKPTSKSH